MSFPSHPFRLVNDLADDAITLILYQEGGRVMAEVIGPHSMADLVAPMPDAVELARERAGSFYEVVVLDDENLWQPGWDCAPGNQQRDRAPDASSGAGFRLPAAFSSH